MGCVCASVSASVSVQCAREQVSQRQQISSHDGAIPIAHIYLIRQESATNDDENRIDTKRRLTLLRRFSPSDLYLQPLQGLHQATSFASNFCTAFNIHMVRWPKLLCNRLEICFDPFRMLSAFCVR